MLRRGSSFLGAPLFALFAIAAGVFFVVEVVRALRSSEPPPWELGRVAALRISDETRAFIGELDGEVLATYYVTRREAMPSELRRLESLVRTVLDGIAAESAGRFTYQVLDPALHPELANYIANEGVTPQRLRTVRQDAWSEREVWSTLVLSYAGRAKTRIEGLRPQHALELQRLICAHLSELERPRRPVVTVAGQDTEQLARSLGLFDAADIRRIDFDARPEIPDDTDVLFWIAPTRCDAAHVRALRLYLDSGGSAVVAGSSLRLELDHAQSPPRVRRLADDDTIELVLAEFGLEAAPGALFDVMSMGVPGPDGTALPAPWRVLGIAPNQDFRGMTRQPAGSLLFEAPTAWRYDPRELEEAGYDARAIASTSADAWILPLDEPLPLEAAALRQGLAVARQALAVWLRPRDPWRGSLVAFGSAAPFQDQQYQRDEYSHKVLGPILRDTLGSRERRVIRRAGIRNAEPLPAMSNHERGLWRVLALSAWPLWLLGLTIAERRRASSKSAEPMPARGQRTRARISFKGLGAGCAIALVFAALWTHLPFVARARADLTRERVHTLSPATAELCARTTERIECEIVFSNPLPPALRSGFFQLEGKLADLRNAGLDLSWRRIAAEDLNATSRADLEARGVSPLRITSRGEETQTVRTLYAHAVFRATRERERESGDEAPADLVGETTEVVFDFPTPVAFENLEFRLAALLWQLEHGRPPRVAIATAPSRLTPAEAHIEYQTRKLFAPTGSDPYQVLRELLRLAGFVVRAIDPKDPSSKGIVERGRRTGDGEAFEAFESDADDAELDLLIWLQPQRPMEPMLAELTRHLRSGRNALVAGQHFEVQSRKVEDPGPAGAAPEADKTGLAHWPNPRFCDLDRGWFAGVGIPLVRELLFDAVHGERTLDATLSGGGEERELAREETAQPFLIRAIASSFATDSVIVQSIGDVLFPSGNRFRIDAERLALHGLEARELVRTSSSTWSFDWSGGNIPPAVLGGPAAPQSASTTEDGTPLAQPLDRQPLAIEVAGVFPPFFAGEDAAGAIVGPDSAAPARLLAIGSSELFGNGLVGTSEYDNASFALNAIATLALGPELGAVMASRQVAPTFEPPDDRRRLVLRAVAVASVPSLFGALLVVSLFARSRSRPSTHSRTGSSAAPATRARSVR